LNEQNRRSLYALISESVASSLPPPHIDADPTRQSLYNLLGVPAHTITNLPKSTALLIDKDTLTLPPQTYFADELASYGHSFKRALEDDWITSMRYTMAATRYTGAVIPRGFRARLREWWVLSRRGHALQRAYAAGHAPRSDWLEGEKLLNRAWCFLLGKHHWSYSTDTATCVDCKTTRRLPQVTAITNIV
jgi:hypothetical protein